MVKPNQKGNVSVPSLIVVIVLMGIGGVLYYYFSSSRSSVPLGGNKVVSKNTTPVPTLSGSSTWKTYTNQKYKFSINYPANILMEEIAPEYVRFHKYIAEYSAGPTETYLSYQIKDNPNKLSLNEWEKKNASTNSNNDSVFKYVEGKDGTIIQVSFIYMEGNKNEMQPIFDRINSTLKFLD